MDAAARQLVGCANGVGDARLRQWLFTCRYAADAATPRNSRGVAPSLALLLYTQLMGITHTWLLAPSLFDLRQQLPLFSRRLLAGLRP